MRVDRLVKGLVAGALVLATAVAADAAPFNVLWWDSTPEYGSQAPNALRQAMSNSLNAVPGNVFNSTYVGSETPGTLATQLSGNSYDVIVFDATTAGQRFNAADIAAIQAHYSAGNRNLLFDGTLYIRSINFNSTTIYPGPNGATGNLTINEVHQLANRGGGIMVGTDHNCCQTDANQVVQAILPSASFSGSTFPSTDGVFFGSDLVNGLQPFAPADVFQHWDSVPTEGIPPLGTFTDFEGNSVTLFNQVEAADDPGGGPRFPYITTSWAPGASQCDINNPELCPDTDDGETDGNTDGDGSTGVPYPGTLMLIGAGLVALGVARRRR